MKPIERLEKARIQIQLKNPFFAFLSFYIKFEENAEITEDKGIAVNDLGTIYFKPEYIMNQSDEQLIGIIAHEILHLALLHLLRKRNKKKERWDIASDLVVNTTLMKNNFKLPNDALCPNSKFEYIDEHNHISNIDKKLVESVYYLLRFPPQPNNQNSGDGPQQPQGQNQQNQSSGNSNGNGNKKQNSSGSGSGHDKHIDNSEGRSQSENQKIENDWQEKMSSAFNQAKMIGKLPLDIERLFDNLGKSQLDWRTILQDYIEKILPSDYSYLRRNKKSIRSGFYLPNLEKEKVTMAIGVDTSGSIEKEELDEFLTEIFSIYDTFSEHIEMHIISHDVTVHSDDLIEYNYDLEQVHVKGGGGTSHKHIMKYINEELPDLRLAVFITDGFSDLEEIEFSNNNFDSIFVISSNGSDKQLENSNVFRIKLEKINNDK